MKDLRIKRLTVHQYKWKRRDLTGDYNGFNHVYLKGGEVEFTDYVLTMETEAGITGEYAGGVGVSAVELGKALGGRVIACASTDEKVAFCKEHGADDGINYVKEDLKARAKELTKGNGADVVYDPVGGAFSEAALRSIAWEGRFLVVGFATGDIPKIPLNLALLKGCQICGVFWGSFAMREPQKNRANGEKIFAWIEEGKLKPHVDAVFPFAEARTALERMERREVKGKLVLVP